MLTLDTLIGNPDQIFETPKKDLRQALQNGTDEKIRQLFDKISEEDWLEQKEPKKVSKLATKMQYCAPENLPYESFNQFMKSFAALNPPAPKKSHTKKLMIENPGFCLRLVTHPKPPPALESSQAKLAFFEAVLKADCQESIDYLLSQEISFEETYGTLNLFEIAALKFDVITMGKVLKKIVSELEDPLPYLRQGLWVFRSIENSIEPFLQICEELGIREADLVYAPNEKDLLTHCISFSKLKKLLLCLDENVQREALHQRGAALILNFLHNRHDTRPLISLLCKQKIWTPFKQLDLEHISDEGLETILSHLTPEERQSILPMIPFTENDLEYFSKRLGLWMILRDAGVLSE